MESLPFRELQLKAQQAGKLVFLDRYSSNNAARVRLWVYARQFEDNVLIRFVAHNEQHEPDFLALNPQGKIPVLVLPDGTAVPESGVILQYLEDKFGGSPPLILGSAEERMRMALFIKIHDTYLSTPNCTQPGFTHTQGCMYVPPPIEGVQQPRTMGLAERAAKLCEVNKQLDFIEQMASQLGGPWLCGGSVSLADLTWYPSCVFYAFYLPKIFKWPDFFHGRPYLAAWFAKMSEEYPGAARVKTQLEEALWKKGIDENIIRETEDSNYKWIYP
jgi:glutathione S-transferase